MKKIKEKHPRGRPSKFNLIEDNLKTIAILFENGCTEAEVVKLLNIDISTLTKWKQKNAKFFTSLKDWKLKADERVERSLYERAIGYEHEDTYFGNYQGTVIAAPFIKHYPPDPTSMIFWLKNRQPDKWRDKQEIEHSGELKLVINGIEKL